MTTEPPARTAAFLRVQSDSTATPIVRPVAEETPVAIEFNGLGYAVLMASAADLDDLAFGFALSERLIEQAGQIVAIDHHPADRGHILRMTLAEECTAKVADRVRHRVSESSCGLCGIENLEQALRPLPRRAPGELPTPASIFAALAALRDAQPLNRLTGAVHAAALCDAAGNVLLVREDVGRHNAFDKLIGAMLRAGAGWGVGFALLSSRCSYELVEKAALSACPTLVTISAPTGLAIERAREAGVRLAVLARADAILVVE